MRTWKKLKWKPTQNLSYKQWEEERLNERVNERGHARAALNKPERELDLLFLPLP